MRKAGGRRSTLKTVLPITSGRLTERQYLSGRGCQIDRRGKPLPDDFPRDEAERARGRSRLPGTPPPPLDTQGACPSMTMPRLMAALGLVVLPE